MDATNSDVLTSSVTPIEQRRSPRRWALRKAMIVYRDGNCTIGCSIIDTSDAGALLRPADITICPRTFVLRPSVGPSRNCEVVWRHRDFMGVRYIEDGAFSAEKMDGVDSDDFLALKRDHDALVADFEELKNTVQQLIAKAGR